MQRFYASVYADTGGEPARDEITDGCYVNYPDVDLQNWPTPYFGPNYSNFGAAGHWWVGGGSFGAIRAPIERKMVSEVFE
jgi:hypothetical protein